MTPPLRRVLMTADTIGGIWTFALGLARELAAEEVEVVLATMGALPTEAQREEARSIAPLVLCESAFALEWMTEPWEEVAEAGAWLLALEEQFRPDVIHLNGYTHAALPWRAPVLVAGHSCVLSWWQGVHGEKAPAAWARYAENVRAGLRAARLVVAPTETMHRALREHYGPLREARVIFNGADPARFVPLAKEPFLLAAGRLGDAAKNVATLAAAAGELPWPLLVAGPERDASGAAALPPNLRALGVLPPEALAEHMGRASIYCLPARYEPFGLSILEAALAGCALVLGDIPSLRELWDGAALFASPDDPEELRVQLQFLIEHPGLRAETAKLARERALTFSLAQTAAGYLAAYRSLSSPDALLSA